MTSSVAALRGPLVYFVDDPFLTDPGTAFVHEPDGLVICRGGKIDAVGAANRLLPTLPPGVVPTHYADCLISAGFIDTHIHYVQTGIVGAFGEQLLEWLDNYTYVAEQAFRDEAYAHRVAKLFCDQLLRNGTTSALVFCAVFPQSVDALFEEASLRNMRLVAGKVLMDRNAPAALLDTAMRGYDDSKSLIGKWHGRGRNLYAITPRFAATSSPEQLELAGALWREHPDAFVQSHIAENAGRDRVGQEAFPSA